MARKDDIKATMATWLPTGEQPEHPKGAAELALYRRAGAAGELIAMAPDGQAWRVPDQAGGWEARVAIPAPEARGLKRLGSTDEARALARIGADLGQPDQAAPATSAEPTPKRSTSTKAAAAGKAPGGKPGGRDAQVVAYLTAVELAALVERAAADDRSVSYVARAAIRAYLGLG